MSVKTSSPEEKQKESSQQVQTLGEYLRNIREIRRLTLREVEEASDVSNAYLSQLENGKITKPSPHVLHKLAAVYNISYETLMEKAGYISRSEKSLERRKKNRSGKLPAFSQADLTQEEEEELLQYLAFLRSRKRKL